MLFVAFEFYTPILSGTIMKTKDNVHGNTIIESPATYAITNHEIYETSFYPSTANSFVNENITLQRSTILTQVKLLQPSF